MTAPDMPTMPKTLRAAADSLHRYLGHWLITVFPETQFNCRPRTGRAAGPTGPHIAVTVNRPAATPGTTALIARLLADLDWPVHLERHDGPTITAFTLHPIG